MSRKSWIGGLLGGLVVFIWGNLSWTVIPIHEFHMKDVPEAAINEEVIRTDMLATGVYHFPGFPSEEEMQADPKAAMAGMMEEYMEGPIIHFMVVDADGGPWMNPISFLWYFLINVGSALLIAWMLSKAVGGLPKYTGRFVFVLVAGLFAFLFGPLTMWNWWHFPANFTFATLIDYVISWGGAGLVMAHFIRPDIV
ncbi:hypothetical protein GF324_10720 [bacterium]|nr:hypothetical protein [bacterium]